MANIPEPKTRKEMYLSGIAGETNLDDLPEPVTREEQYLAYIAENGGGSSGEGGTTNYNALSNKPKINGVTLSGDKTSADLNIEGQKLYSATGQNTDGAMTQKSTTDGLKVITDAVSAIESVLSQKQNELTAGMGISIADDVISVLYDDTSPIQVLENEYGDDCNIWELSRGVYVINPGDGYAITLCTAPGERRINLKYGGILIVTYSDNQSELGHKVPFIAIGDDLNAGLSISYGNATDESFKKQMDVNIIALSEISSNGSGSGSPIGTVTAYMGATAPNGYLMCDGSEYATSDYPVFAQWIKDNMGDLHFWGGNDDSHFCVPDLRGEFLRGAGTNSHANQGSGADAGVHQDGTQIPQIGFNLAAAGSTSGTGLQMKGTASSFNEALDRDSNILTKNYVDINTTNMVQTSESDLVGAYMTRPTNTSVNYIIKVKS